VELRVDMDNDKELKQDGLEEQKKCLDKADEGSYMMSIGMALGASMGLLFDNMATGLAVGMCLGMAVGAVIKKK